jgi:glycosyltransferase involved in cell wall biosynthesis
MLLTIAAGLIGVPVLVLLIEVIASLRAPKEQPFEQAALQSVARLVVVVPAHNEGAGIIPTLRDLSSQLNESDHLLVVADNCNDDTAEVALAEGAEVTRRDEPNKIGKGYAMGWGISHIARDPPDLVLFVDADCRVHPDSVQRLKTVCQQIMRPVQALYLMRSAEGLSIDHSLAEFAWILKNRARPLGLRNLHCPVQLMGTGMIFPWEVINEVQLASGSLVEDLKLGLDLAAVRRAPYFFPFARVTSEFPTTKSGAEIQRQRWVKGHIGTISFSVPRLLWLGLRERNFNLLVLTFDLLVPPLSLLALLVVGLFGIAGLSSLFGFGLVALLISAGNLLAFCLSVTLGWLAFGQQALPRSRLRSLGPFFFQKAVFYGRLLAGKTATHWIRADRTKLK